MLHKRHYDNVVSCLAVSRVQAKGVCIGKEVNFDPVPNAKYDCCHHVWSLSSAQSWPTLYGRIGRVLPW